MEKVIADAQEALGTALTTHFKDVLDSHCTELKVQLKSAQIDFVELNKAKLVVERKMKNMLRESKAFDRKITAKDAIITKLKDDVSSLREVLKTQKNEIQNLKRECSSLRAQAETVVGGGGGGKRKNRRGAVGVKENVKDISKRGANSNNKASASSVVVHNENSWKIRRIVGEKSVRGQKHFLLEWEPSWERSSHILDKDLIRVFKKENDKKRRKKKKKHENGSGDMKDELAAAREITERDVSELIRSASEKRGSKNSRAIAEQTYKNLLIYLEQWTLVLKTDSDKLLKTYRDGAKIARRAIDLVGSDQLSTLSPNEQKTSFWKLTTLHAIALTTVHGLGSDNELCIEAEKTLNEARMSIGKWEREWFNDQKVDMLLKLSPGLQLRQTSQPRIRSSEHAMADQDRGKPTDDGSSDDRRKSSSVSSSSVGRLNTRDSGSKSSSMRKGGDNSAFGQSSGSGDGSSSSSNSSSSSSSSSNGSSGSSNIGDGGRGRQGYCRELGLGSRLEKGMSFASNRNDPNNHSHWNAWKVSNATKTFCSYCGKQARLYTCGGCKRAQYCGEVCQKAAWEGGHIVDCEKLRHLKGEFISVHQADAMAEEISMLRSKLQQLQGILTSGRDNGISPTTGNARSSSASSSSSSSFSTSASPFSSSSLSYPKGKRSKQGGTTERNHKRQKAG